MAQASPLQEYRAPNDEPRSPTARGTGPCSSRSCARTTTTTTLLNRRRHQSRHLQKHEEKPQAAPVGPVLWRGERLAPFALRERRLVAQNESIEASPLETKRRNRARPVDLSRGASIPSDTVRSSGALKVEQLKTASRQLAANARRPELGPGAPAALGASSKFVALGTSSRPRAGLRPLPGSATSPGDGFHGFGEVRGLGGRRGLSGPRLWYLVVLWDVVKGSQLRRWTTPSPCPSRRSNFAVGVRPIEPLLLLILLEL